jgi:hypothetical protein
MKARKRTPDDFATPTEARPSEARDRGTLARARDTLRGSRIPGVELGSNPDRPREKVTLMDARRRGPRAVPDLVTLDLRLDPDGVLRWDTGTAAEASRLGAQRKSVFGAPIVEQAQFTPLAPSEVTTFLADADRALTPERGLRVYGADGQGKPWQVTVGKRKRILLFVHGTFSHSQHVFDEITGTDDGRAVYSAWQGRYDAVLGFDHATLGVSPMINALDLAAALDRYPGRIDVFSHSRGGLVTRWWLEHFATRRDLVTNAVLVGSPLVGTSLAAPAALRKTLDLLSNVMTVIAKAAKGVSSSILSGVIQVLARVVGTILHWAGKSPLADVAIALVPGLEAMSRVRGNAELERLELARAFPIERYATVEANFVPTEPGWQFWKHFTDQPKMRLVDAGADFLFGGANDLVVDTLSMGGLRGPGAVGKSSPCKRRLELRGDAVHHLSYFTSKRVVDFLDAELR